MNEHNEFGLFGGASLSGFLKAKLAAACARAECLTRADFLASSPDVLGNAIVESFAVTPLALHLDQMQRPLYNTCDVGSEWYQRQMEETMSEIDRQLDGQARSLKQYHLDLAEAAGRAVARRGQQLQTQGA